MRVSIPVYIRATQVESRELMAFQTALGLMRMTHVVKVGTNSLQAF